MNETLLTIDALSVSNRRTGATVLHDVTLEVGRGESVALVGESGSGKSMTARSVMRLLPAQLRTSGSIRFDDQDVLSLTSRAMRKLRTDDIAMISQDPRSGLDPVQTCGHSLTELQRRLRGRSRSQAVADALSALADVEIRDPQRVFRAYPHELSGGMLQRVLIAGTLLSQPRLLIADEATTALDVTVQAEIIGLFRALVSARGSSLLLISHDLDLAATVCDRIVVMYAGRIVECQPTADLMSQPLHPYTEALLAARPQLGAGQSRLSAIPGRPPASPDSVTGCAFHPRCQHATASCAVDTPTLSDPAAGPVDAVSCWVSPPIHEPHAHEVS